MQNTAQHSHASERLGRLMALTSAFCLGLNTTLARLAYDGGSNPGTVAFIRFVVTTLAIALLMIVIRRKFVLSRKAILPVLGVGAAVVLQSATYLSSVTFIPVGLAVLLFYTYPLMVAAARMAQPKKNRRCTAAKIEARTAFMSYYLIEAATKAHAGRPGQQFDTSTVAADRAYS